MKRSFLFLLFLFCLKNSFAQSNTIKRKIAIFAPLYLDSVFKHSSYITGKKFPRFTLQGLDFVQGAKIALDSFPVNNATVETIIYDTKSDSNTVRVLIEKKQLDDLDLMIGLVKDEDLNQLADFGKTHQIPFLSTTLPNDNGIENNPYFIILNPTLKTHCESIYSYLLQNHSSDNIIIARKSGTQEDKAEGYFKAINKQDKKDLLHLKSVLLDSNFTTIIKELDSTKKNCIVGASLDEEFAKELISSLKKVDKKYEVAIFGMPNWNGFSAFGRNIKSDYRDVPFYFTSPYYNDKTDSICNVVQNKYLEAYKGLPSEMAFKGFEMMYFFSRMIVNHKEDFMERVNNSSAMLFTKYKILPVFSKDKKNSINYYENKNLYFIKKLNGKTSKAW